MSKEYEPEALVEIEIDLDAYESKPNTYERRVAKEDRREIPERRFLERVVIENEPRRQNSDRRG